MKSALRLIFISLIALNTVIIYSCGGSAPDTTSEDSGESVEAAISVENAILSTGKSDIKKNLERHYGVTKTEFSPDGKIVTVTYYSQKISLGQLKVVIENAGFKVLIAEFKSSMNMNQGIMLSVEGMTCESCASAIKNVLLSESGVKDVLVSVDYKSVQVTYDAAQITVEKIKEVVNDLGFTVVS